MLPGVSTRVFVWNDPMPPTIVPYIGPPFGVRAVAAHAFRLVDRLALGDRSSSGRQALAVARADVDVPGCDVGFADRLAEADRGDARMRVTSSACLASRRMIGDRHQQRGLTTLRNGIACTSPLASPTTGRSPLWCWTKPTIARAFAMSAPWAARSRCCPRRGSDDRRACRPSSSGNESG